MMNDEHITVLKKNYCCDPKKKKNVELLFAMTWMAGVQRLQHASQSRVLSGQIYRISNCFRGSEVVFMCQVEGQKQMAECGMRQPTNYILVEKMRRR